MLPWEGKGESGKEGERRRATGASEGYGVPRVHYPVEAAVADRRAGGREPEKWR